ncbi:hypothetical protein A9Q84_14330 [Halobacteriovorax marinus]|uniref:Glutathione S-transferase n=1 Tax=Halobacteriovorax marinus TaxID=97084 RepID=A0A1Y5F8S9_9BACT|nr:hypothetical protein A9Q84_14330 [Halobacteriovorax marinus]
MIDLYTDATPNGLKVSIALEELGLEYNVHQLYLGGDQFDSEFTTLNPNNKIPVLKDQDIVISESGAILYYLAEKHGKLLGSNLAEKTKVIEMLMFQMSGIGPYLGQYLVFAAAWGNEFPKVTNRYFKETSRILKVLNKRLEGKEFIAGDEFSIADVSFIPWINLIIKHPATGQLPLEENKNVFAWINRMLERPAVIKGLNNPAPYSPEKQFKGFVDATIGHGPLHE